MKVKKGDTVQVIAGKDRKKTGKVLRALPRTGQVIVEGLNIRKKHQRPRRSGEKGQIVEKAMPIDSSNVMLLDPSSGKPTRVGFKTENGKKVRIARKSNAAV